MAKQSIDYKSILSDLKKKIYKPVYFLMGEEPYFIDLISDYIQENVLTEEQKAFNQIVCYGSDVSMHTIIDNAIQYPTNSPYLVIIVKEAQNMDDFDDLVGYLKRPSKSTILVFCHKYKKPDGRKKFVSEIDKVGVLFESKKVYDNQVPAFISSYVKEKNIEIGVKATQMLSEFLGTDLQRIVNELNKLIDSNTENTKSITPELVEKNVGISKDYNNFELINALTNRDVFKANQIVFYFKKDPKRNPLVLTMSTLFNFFSNLMMYFYVSDKSDKALVARELGINPYFVDDYKKAAAAFGGWKTMEIISLLREYDAKSKGVDNSSASENELLKELVYKILH